VRILKNVLDANDAAFMQEVNAYLRRLRLSFVLFVSADICEEPSRLLTFRCFVNPWSDGHGNPVACLLPVHLVLLRFERWRQSDSLGIKHYDIEGNYRGDVDLITQNPARTLPDIRSGIHSNWPRPAGATHYLGIDTQGVL
jgi:hypothetical protein